MSTSIYSPSQNARRGSTTSCHRRSSAVSLHSIPSLGLIKTISRDLVHGWHTPTALKKEPCLSSPSPSAPVSRAYKPRHAARDALRGFTPATTHEAQTTQQTAESYFEQKNKNGPDTRSRQDSLTPISPITQKDATKPLACVEAGLIPDHSFDTWTAAWDSAYEQRVKTNQNCAIPISPLTPSFPSSTRETGTRKRTRNTRLPLTGRLSVTDAELKHFVFGDREDDSRARHCESPEAFLMPRRGSEVPSLVLSDVSSRDSGLEDLEEEEGEEGEEGESEEEMKILVDDEEAKSQFGAREKMVSRVFVAPVVAT
ncbi:hypothetical protein QM012_004101 [Aureobasidium pullulans]|uniref:Uncharacterized protein n=1 Tax=Aureobasidium pullulans TaxID=5580 RepID=A0ABR0T6Q9_AURPU